MIWESCYWKADLLRYAVDLRKKMRQRRLSESSSVAVEKLVFLGFYSIRKLFEAKKLSSSLGNHPIAITVYPPTLKRVTHINWHKTDQLFHMDRGTPANTPLSFLCNQVIHSYVFQLGCTEAGTLDFMLLCSDRQRTEGLLHVALSDVASTFERAGNDNPTKTSMVFNFKRKDYDVHNE